MSILPVEIGRQVPATAENLRLLTAYINERTKHIPPLIKWCMAARLGPGFTVHLRLEQESNPEFEAAVIQACREFFDGQG